MRSLFFLLFTAITMLITLSCSESSTISEYVLADQGVVVQTINNWNIVGTFTKKQDKSIKGNLQYGKFFEDIMKTDSTIRFLHNGVYKPQYGQLDLREVFNINVADTTKVLDSLVTYLSCKIQVEKSRNMFLLVNTKMEHTEYLNGDSLTDKGIKELYIIPVSLKSGKNDLVVRVTGGKGDYWYEATLYDSVSIAKMYAEEHTGNIIYPIMEKNIFLVGEVFTNPLVGDLVKRIRSNEERKSKDDITLTLHDNPENKDHLVLLYTSRKGSRFKHLINYPWKSAFSRRMIAKYE